MDVSGQPLHKYSDMSPSFRILLCHWVGWYKTDSQFLVDLKQAEKGNSIRTGSYLYLLQDLSLEKKLLILKMGRFPIVTFCK